MYLENVTLSWATLAVVVRSIKCKQQDRAANISLNSYSFHDQLPHRGGEIQHTGCASCEWGLSFFFSS